MLCIGTWPRAGPDVIRTNKRPAEPGVYWSSNKDTSEKSTRNILFRISAVFVNVSTI